MAAETHWVAWRTRAADVPKWHADASDDAGARTLCGLAIPYGDRQVSMLSCDPGSQKCAKCAAKAAIASA